MHYILQDLLRLPLGERLKLIEYLIVDAFHSESSLVFQNDLKNKLESVQTSKENKNE